MRHENKETKNNWLKKKKKKAQEAFVANVTHFRLIVGPIPAKSFINHM
jgi:DNA-binding transcriptional regulator YbjK